MSCHAVLCCGLQAVREQRMAQELAAAKRERDFYLSRVDRAKALDAMQQRRSAKQQQQQGAGDANAPGQAAPAAAGAAAAGGVDGLEAGAAGQGVKRLYGQRKAKADPTQPGAGGISEDVLGLLVAPKKKQRSI